MKILLDENLPYALRRELPGHDVHTVGYLRWKGVKNGRLLAQAATELFEAVLTMDDGVEYQQNLETLPVAVVIIEAPSNDIDDLMPLVPRLLTTLQNLQPRTITRVW